MEEKQFRILVVDDEEIVQSLVRDALEDEGYDVSTASDGHDALRILIDKPVELLITDIRMPGMDGIKLVERARDLHPGIGVIFITGYASLNSAKDAIKQGALDYVMKPFELHEIRQAVENAISKLEDTATTSSDQQLNSLSDLNHMLFTAGDKKSLITSSLKFAMMHLHSDRGAIVYTDDESGQYIMLNIDDNAQQEIELGHEPLRSILKDKTPELPQEPALVSCLDDHPLYNLQSDPELAKFIMPPWMDGQHQMITLPVARADQIYGQLMLECEGDTVKLRQTDFKFLSITASQLAITLENLSLLEETRQAYARLKELQDETIELEKMAARGEMSAEIGHELNNFLGVVAGNVSLLEVHLQRGNYDKLDKYMKTVTSTIEKIKVFTGNLMDLRRISSKKEVVRFERLISEVVEYLRPQKRFRGVEIDIPKITGSFPFLADVTQIQQLLYNLFHNAADAMIDSETRRITITVDSNADQNTFQFSIRDTGKGFEPETLSQAFREKFTTKENGHGFGLVVCRRIIDNHGGELEVESSPGNGTCISIKFPLASEVAEPETAPVG